MHHERTEPSGMAAIAGALHPTLKDENGNPMINIQKMEEHMQKLAVKYASEAAGRVGLWTEEAKKANAVLRTEMDAVGGIIEDAKEMRKVFIETLRSMRTTSTTEVAAMMRPLEDLRKFFLGADHQKEVERLKEFVELCERLEKLKKSGFLDSVADTLLKLA